MTRYIIDLTGEKSLYFCSFHNSFSATSIPSCADYWTNYDRALSFLQDLKDQNIRYSSAIVRKLIFVENVH